MKRRGIGRWVIDGEHLRHDKVWSKDPDKRTCGWGTKMPKSFEAVSSSSPNTVSCQ